MANLDKKKELIDKATERFYSHIQNIDAIPEAERNGIVKRMIFISPHDGLAVERILGHSDIVGADYLELGLLVSKAVCRLQVINSLGYANGYGTGFLVGPNLLLTSRHFFKDAIDAVNSFVEFDYEEGMKRQRKPVKAFNLRPEEIFITDTSLDFTFVAVAPKAIDGTLLSDYGFLPLVEESGKVILGEYLSMIQHPGGRYKAYSLRNCDVISILDKHLHYRTHTGSGATGSPVFNDQWFVVALQQSGIPKRDGEGNILRTDGQIYDEDNDDPSSIDWMANEGVRISSIFKALEERKKDEPMVAEVLHRLRSYGIGLLDPPVVAPNLGIKMISNADERPVSNQEITQEILPTQKTFDVFLCHNSDDKSDVMAIGKKLQAFNIEVWLDEWELIPGSSWIHELQKTD